MDNKEVIELLHFTLGAARHLFGNHPPQKGLDPTFYHTNTYEGDLELHKKLNRADEVINIMIKDLS